MPSNQQYDKRSTIVLYPNDRMRAGKQDPDYTGTLVDANGNEHWLSAWVKTSAKGEFLTGAYRPKEARSDAPLPRSGPRPLSRARAESDDIPN